MDAELTTKIREYSTDIKQQNSFLALLDYYNVNSLMEVTQEMGEEFLAKLESGEIRIRRGY